MSAEAPRAYNFPVLLRILLWQHVGDLRLLSGITKENWSTRARAQTQDPELVCLTASH